MISNEKVNTIRVNGVNTAGQTIVSAVKGNGVTAVRCLIGFIAFGGSARGGKITGKGKIRTDKLDFEDVFLLLDASQVLLRVPRQSNIYNFDLKNVVPSRDLTCLFAKATINESKLWHRRLGHVNFKTMNKLVKGNLVRGLPSKIYLCCLSEGKQHKASCELYQPTLTDVAYGLIWSNIC
ncbi:putative ribonuclease H-like domain-containing protein [Tanacetum coccineum]